MIRDGAEVCKAGKGAPADDSGHGDGWCLRFRGDTAAGDASGCGPASADAWCVHTHAHCAECLRIRMELL